MPRTWNDAAAQAAFVVKHLADTNLNEFAKSPQGELADCLRFEVDDMIQSFWFVDHVSHTAVLPLYKSIGMLGYFAGKKPLAEVVALIISKQSDYGHDNIARFGHKGLMVRLHDKVARIENLLRQVAEVHESDSGAPCHWKNEPLQDSFDDILGYSIIGVMLCEGTFMLPLAAA